MSLKVGQVVLYGGVPHRVAMVNECRALLVPTAKRLVTMQTVMKGQISFEKPQAGISVSPNSELERVRP